MEVRIDSIDEKEIPAGDIFVSMRVGDMQKQSRFSNSRVFRFPESAEGKGPFGRVELFKRIGHATISLERLIAGSAQELKLPCSQDLVAMGQDHIGLRFTSNVKGGAPAPVATAQPAAEDAADPKSKKSRAKARMDAAQKYLQEYRLEELLAETMREVISAKPADPRRFIAERILAEAPLSPVSAAAPLVEATAPPKASAKIFDNFATYYAANMRTIPLDSLYEKFGVKQAAPPAVPPPQARKNTEDLPPPEAPAKEMPPPEARPTQIFDSFGTYYAKHFSIPQSKNLYSSFPSKAPAAPAVDSFGTYYAKHFSIPQSENLYSSFPSKAPAADAKDAGIEDLRKEAASSLIRAAQDGTLEKVLAGSKAAPPTAQDAGIEDLRKEAASSLIRAANDGTLEKVLAQSKPQAAPEVEDLRKEAASSLLRAAQDGTLEKALAGAKAQQPRIEAPGAIDDLKKKAAAALLRSAGDGTLQELLTKVKPAGNDLEQLRAEAASSLLRAAEDGTLEKVLAEATGTQAGEGSLEDLRKEAANSLLRAAEDGTLEKALSAAKSPAGEDSLEDLRKEAANSLLRAAEDGTLEKALSAAKSPACGDDLDTLRLEAKSSLLSAAREGTLEKVLNQIKGGEDLERASRIVKTNLGGDFKMLPSVGAWMGSLPYKAPKAAVKSGPAPWADYYKANFQTADYPGLYAAFSNKAAAPPAPPPAPPAMQVEAEMPAKAAAPAPAAPANAVEFKMLASVGTWFMKPITFQPPGDSRLASLRAEAREALLQGARSGTLTEVLKKNSGQDDLRQQARDALIAAASSGKLVEALKQADTLQDDIALLRQQAKEALLQGAQSGQLLEALKQASPVQDSIEVLRQQARDALLSGAQSGKLQEVLTLKADNIQVSKEDRLKQQAREALLQGARSGSLQATLQQGAADPVEQLRLQAREALLMGAQSGKLREVLKSKKQVSAESVTPGSDFKLRASVGSWLMRHTIFLPGSQALAEAPADRQHEALGKTAESVLSPESPMAHFVADLFHGDISAEEIDIPDHAAAVELVTAFKAELDKKEDEIEQLKAKLMELDSV